MQNFPPVAASAAVITTDELQGLPDAAQAEILALRGTKAELEVANRILGLKVQKLERMLWARKSERLAPSDQRQATGQTKGPN